MSLGILNTALSGLAAFQRSLETTSNNISNVNTEGYSRQRVELATSPEQYLGHGYVGSGVNVTNITRSYDQFVTSQVRSSNSTFGEFDKFYGFSTQIDNITSNPSTSLAPAIKSFFNDVHEVADDPSSIPARQSMLSEAESMTASFNTMVDRFSSIRDQVNIDMDSMVKELNTYASEIAQLNVKIMADTGLSSDGQQPNRLLDQRDLLLNKMAKIIDVSVVNQQDGSISVFIGKGQTLVMNKYAAHLDIQSSAGDSTHKQVVMDGQDITKQLSGGSLNGSLRFRDEVLDPAQQQLGVLAAGMALEFNQQHQLGYDMDAQPGTAFFDLGSPQISVIANATDPSANVTAAFDMPGASAKLKASDYSLTITSGGASPTYILTRLSDNSTITPPVDGFNVGLTGTFTVGDQFLIRPTYNAAAKISSTITDPRQIAAAKGASVGLTGDNENALALAQLETNHLMLNGTATFSDAYGQLVSKVGNQTHAAQVSRSAQEVLLNQATSALESVSGVNLDEEAANLIKFQQSYQAAAQAISVANSLFDSLLGAVR